MLKICSSVQDHNQSTIHKGSDWTSQRAKQFLLKLKASERTASEEMCLKKRVWRKRSEDTSSEEKSSEARSSEARLSKAPHQKPLHQKLNRQSWQSTVYEVYNHQLCACLCNHHLCIFSLHQDKNNSNIAAGVVPSQVEWIWN